MDLIKLNCSPHLKMHEITKKLFNRNFLSDIQFLVDGKIIFAHSLELMKRSQVFEKQLDKSFGEKKLIPITDYDYDSFFEFIRFIYTDECSINERNGIQLLKLAVHYQVIILESRVINLLATGNWILQLFEHCIIDRYEIARQRSFDLFACNMKDKLNYKNFLSIHPDAINAALQLDQIEAGITEVQIFEVLVKWIKNYCNQRKINYQTERPQVLDELIRKIRFPCMTLDQIRNCVNNNPGIISDTDCSTISKQVLFGSSGVNDLWISRPRRVYNDSYDWQFVDHTVKFETKLTVSNDMFLCGLWIGVEESRKPIEIEFTERNIQTNECEKVCFTVSAPPHWMLMLISFGESIVLKQNFEYSIITKYLDIIQRRKVVCRLNNDNLMYNNPDNSVKIIEASNNMIEMIFKPTT